MNGADNEPLFILMIQMDATTHKTLEMFLNEYPKQYSDFKDISTYPAVKEARVYFSEDYIGFACLFTLKNNIQLNFIVNYSEFNLKMAFDEKYLKRIKIELQHDFKERI